MGENDSKPGNSEEQMHAMTLSVLNELQAIEHMLERGH